MDKKETLLRNCIKQNGYNKTKRDYPRLYRQYIGNKEKKYTPCVYIATRKKDIPRALRKKKLIRKLFEQAKQETFGSLDSSRVGLILRKGKVWKSNKCRIYRGKPLNSGEIMKIKIEINMASIKDRTENGYENDYYFERPNRINPLVLNNRHNAWRFIIYHELKHAKDRILHPDSSFELSEYDADSWALEHLKRKGSEIND